MSTLDKRNQRSLEIVLILVSLGLTCLLYRISGYKMLVLNLYFLPVVVAACFLGRYRAGVLSLFCVIAAFVVSLLDVPNFAAYTSPLVIALALTTWGAILALLLDEGSLDSGEASSLRRKEPPFGAKVIRTVLAYVALVYGDAGESRSPDEALREMQCDLDGSFHPAVLDALDRVILAPSPNRRLAVEKMAVEV